MSRGSRTIEITAGAVARHRVWTLPWLVMGMILASVVVATPQAVAASPGSTVEVDSVAELVDAIAEGASRIVIEPGEYVVDGTIVLEDVELIGSSEVTFRAADPNLNALTLTPLFAVAGDVVVDNLGFDSGGFAYIGAVAASSAQPRNRIAIRNSRFETGLFDPFDPDFVDPPEPRWFITAVILGNVFAGPAAPAVAWDVHFADNYIDGGFAGLSLGDFISDSSGGSMDAIVEQNHFHGSLDPSLVVVGSFAGSNATVRGISRDNLYTGLDNPFGFGASGLAVNGGIGNINDPGADGGSFARVSWTSRDEQFVNSGGIFAVSGRRYRIGDGISEGNDVRLRILSPVFQDSDVRDITIAASSNNFPDEILGDFSANGDGEGNTIDVTLRGADFSGEPGRVWIVNHAGTQFDPVPPMPTEPSYGNKARFTGSPRALQTTNPDINEIPPEFFTGRGNP